MRSFLYRRILPSALVTVAALAACSGSPSPSPSAAGEGTRPPPVGPGTSSAAPVALGPGGADASPPRAIVVPDPIAEGDADVVTVIHTDAGRHAISPLVYGMNSAPPGVIPASVLAGVSFLRRGGDRCNAYNWETNLSNGSLKAGYANDMYLARDLAAPAAPGELDRALIAANIAGGPEARWSRSC